ncbi:hypothetical protein, partial [Neisseria arctica]|uniref:hypothetical protein n=1 Tax=Neisseria arctica TaxID=1470200 RepID=UPI001F190F6B
VQCQGPAQLYTAKPQSDHPSLILVANCHRSFEYIAMCCAIGQALFEFCGFSFKRFIANCLDFRFAAIDSINCFTLLFEQTVIT